MHSAARATETKSVFVDECCVATGLALLHDQATFRLLNTARGLLEGTPPRMQSDMQECKCSAQCRHHLMANNSPEPPQLAVLLAGCIPLLCC